MTSSVSNPGVPNRTLDIQARLSFRSLVHPARIDPLRSQLVLVEAGAPLTGLWVTAARNRDARLVQQAKAERPEDFLLRVFGRAALLDRSEKPLTRVVFALAGQNDRHTAAARRTIARALLTRLSANGNVELLFWAALSEPESRHELLALTEALVIAHGASGARVRVRFMAAQQGQRVMRGAAAEPDLAP